MATLSSPTLQRLISNVRTLLNQPDRNNSFWSDDELTTYLNDAISIYFLEVTLNREGQFTTTTNLNLVAGTEEVSLPTDCFEVRTLWRKVTNGYVALPFRNRVDEGYSTLNTGGGDSYVPYYYLRQNKIVLRPQPDFSETAGLKLEYIQLPDTIVFGGDSLTNQISPVFKQLIEMYAVYKAKLKESLVNGTNLHVHAESNMNTIYKAFKDTIGNRAYSPTFVKPFNPEIEGM
jgi:hypothetical protein